MEGEADDTEIVAVVADGADNNVGLKETSCKDDDEKGSEVDASGDTDFVDADVVPRTGDKVDCTEMLVVVGDGDENNN